MKFDSTDSLIADIAAGKMVVLVDDEDRENEGDLICAAENVTSQQINFMASHGKGLICLAMSPEKCDALNLPMMTNLNRTKNGTAFTVSIEAAEGITTGISAADRAHTIVTASSKDAKPQDIVQPGHVFPLRASPGGVLSRAGHTEAACDLARLAKLEPAGVICEIMSEDGTMARRDELLSFAQKHDLKIGTIEDLIHYRTVKEKSVSKEFEGNKEIGGKTFHVTAWRDSIFDRLHIALVHGDLGKTEAPLVRVHVQNLLHDLIGLEGFGSRINFQEGLDRITQEECGVMLLIGNPQDTDSQLNDLTGAKVSVAPETKTIGIGSQILSELGLTKIRLLATPVKYSSLGGYDLEVVGFES